MSHDDMVAALINQISTDAGLLALVRFAVTQTITTQMGDDRLTVITTALGLYVTPGP